MINITYFKSFHTMSFSRLVRQRSKTDFPSQERGVWKRERSQHWWNDLVKQTYDDKFWIVNFCMTRGTFFYICEQLE